MILIFKQALLQNLKSLGWVVEFAEDFQGIGLTPCDILTTTLAHVSIKHMLNELRVGQLTDLKVVDSIKSLGNGIALVWFCINRS